MNSTQHLPVNHLHNGFKYVVLAALCILLAVTWWLAGNGQLQHLDHLLMGNLIRENTGFLEDAERRARSITLLLAELHAGLMVLQSSEFGISFFVNANIQLGNIISQLTEMVAYGRNFALFNLVALHSIDTLLTMIQWLTPWLVLVAEVGMIAIVATDTWLPTRSRLHMSLIRFGEGVLIIVFLLAFIFPLSVNAVSKTSQAVTEALFHDSYHAIRDTRHHILKGDSYKSIKDDASSSLEQFSNIKVKLSEKTSHLATNMTRYVAITLLEVFILPILFTLLMLWCFRALLRRHSYWRSGLLPDFHRHN